MFVSEIDAASNRVILKDYDPVAKELVATDVNIVSKKLFKEKQALIPERCWIEDYKRKYFRPYEVYKDTMFISMMEGGQKTHQRKQYETYQNIYNTMKKEKVSWG